jgi:hypothetical protein
VVFQIQQRAYDDILYSLPLSHIVYVQNNI